MLRTVTELLETVRLLYADSPPRPFALIEGLERIHRGASTPQEVAAAVRSNASHIRKLAANADAIEAVLATSLSFAATPEAMTKPRRIVGQLLLGEIAERAFVDIYREAMGTNELQLEDDRESRNDTDYRVLNGQRRPVFRINIKFHGTPFVKARELVGLEPDDSFALATYKIHQGLVKHDTERLPYVFVIVGVPGLTGASASAALPEDFAHLIALVQSAKDFPGKRAVEERIVGYLLDHDRTPAMQRELARFRELVRGAPWYVISARRADALLRSKLFDRVFGVRVRGFAKNYRNAELDMHFSLSKDLTPLDEFLRNARERGIHGLAVDLERGTI